MSGRTHDRHEVLIRKTALLELALDAIDQGFSVLDADLNVVIFNRRFLDICGFPADRFRPGDTFQAFAAHLGRYGQDALAAFHLKRLLAGETGTRIALFDTAA